jgi:hypothetical protein
LLHDSNEHDYGALHESEICRLVLTPCDRYFFSSDADGHIKQIYVPEKTLLKDFGRVRGNRILSILPEMYSKYLFTSDESGEVLQLRISEKEVNKSLTEALNKPITCMV